MNEDELILRRKKQNADRARAYRKRKKYRDAMPSSVQSDEPVSENIIPAKVLHQKKLNAERCRRYRQKCKRLKSGANFNQGTSDSDSSTSRDTSNFSSGTNVFCGVEQDITNPITTGIKVLNTIKDHSENVNMFNANTLNIKKEFNIVEGSDNRTTLIKVDPNNLKMLNTANTFDIKKELNTVEETDNLNALKLEPLMKNPRGLPPICKNGRPESNKPSQEQIREATARYMKVHPEAVWKAAEEKLKKQINEKGTNSAGKKSRAKKKTTDNEDMKMTPTLQQFLGKEYLFLKPIKTVCEALVNGKSNPVKKQLPKIKEKSSETSQTVEHGRGRRPNQCKLKSMEKTQDLEEKQRVAVYIKTEAMDNEYITCDNTSDTIESIGKAIKTEPEDEYDTAAESDRKIEYITFEVPLGDAIKTEVIDEFEVKTVVKMEIDIEPELIH